MTYIKSANKKLYTTEILICKRDYVLDMIHASYVFIEKYAEVSYL